MKQKKDISYDAAMEEINRIISNVENNELGLDELSKNVKRVSELIAICKKKLKETDSEIQEILNSIDD